MTQDLTKKIIQELCPDVRSGSRGYQQIQLDRAYQDYLDICKEVSKEDSSRTWASAGMAFERVKRLSNALAVFQDEHITLAVVLRAIAKAGNLSKYRIIVDIDGEFGKYQFKDGEMGIWEVNANWNLAKDNYDNQTQECKDFIGSLLTTKK